MENRLFIIGRDYSFRDGLKEILEVNFGERYQIITQEKISLRKGTFPKLILIESSLGDLETQILSECKANGTKIVLLTSGKNNELPIELDLFDSFLAKKMTTNEMMNVLENLLEHDEHFVHPEMGLILLDRYNRLLNALKEAKEK